MNCEKARKWISLEMDGELAPRRVARLQAHLEACAGCRKTRDEWASVGVRMRERQIPVLKSPEAAWADVRRAIRSDQDERYEEEESWVVGAPLRWAAAALLVMIIGSGLFLSLQKGAVGMARAGGTEVEFVETGLPDATPMVYEDSESGWTVIWVVEANGKKGKHAGS
jgi:predicted anti-sigma-YlaC factor YlaD